MEINLIGKVAIVTGAGRGIGLEIATVLAREGVKTVVADVDQERLDAVKALFADEGLEGRQYLCDVRESAAVQAMVDDVVHGYGRVDILVNNAGVAGGGWVETLPEDLWDRNHDINLKGTFLMCRAVIPTMKRQQSGRIINAASFAAIVPSIRGAAYASSKAAVVQLTRVLAGELGPWNITVNAYAPGMIPTDMNRFAERSPERQDALLDKLSLRRWGEKRDIAHLVCFLASDLAGYITGSLIDVSGGKLATQDPRRAYEESIGGKGYG